MVTEIVKNKPNYLDPGMSKSIPASCWKLVNEKKWQCEIMHIICCNWIENCGCYGNRNSKISAAFAIEFVKTKFA